MYGYIAKNIKEGRQCYMICPLVEETEAIEAVSAEEMYKRISAEFKGINVALMHGKLSGKEKTRIMEDFASGEVQILVSTTVVEVGVNVPNATIMVIENANRFGLAQLHQLRGRVGRGENESFCFLMPGEGENVSLERLEIMTKTQNGFEIAEYDLNLRGPGDFLGTRQHGLPDIEMAGFIKDMSLVKETKEALQMLNNSQYAQEKAVLQAYAREKNAKKHENIAMN